MALPCACCSAPAYLRPEHPRLKKLPEDPKGRQFLQLNHYRRERTAVHVYLLSGTRFTGRVRSFDVHTLLLETQQGEMAIYTHAISTIEPAAARGRKPAPSGRRPEPATQTDAPRRWARPQAQLGGDGRPWDIEDEVQEDRAPAPSVPTAPAAPTVTIVRRRSRLLPRSE